MPLSYRNSIDWFLYERETLVVKGLKSKLFLQRLTDSIPGRLYLKYSDLPLNLEQLLGNSTVGPSNHRFECYQRDNCNIPTDKSNEKEVTVYLKELFEQYEL